MMTEPDFRALCAELADRLEDVNRVYRAHQITSLVTRARAALAQPAPKPPTNGAVTNPSVNPWNEIQSRYKIGKSVGVRKTCLSVVGVAQDESSLNLLVDWLRDEADRAEAGDE
jgi:hypothetical protein